MIYLGADYAGYNLKEILKKHLDKKKIKYHDFGAFTNKDKNDFTEFALPVAKKVSKSKNDIGVLICGTGYGMCIAANRFKKIRATLVNNRRQAKWAKSHDNANVLCLAAWSITIAKATKILDIWLKTNFKPLARRVRRFNTIDKWRT